MADSIQDALSGNYSGLPSTSATSPIPTGGGTPNVGDASQLLIRLLQQAGQGGQGGIVNKPQVMLPQQLPPQHHEPGDVSGNFVNPNTMGGPARNARVTMAQSIGKLVANVENQAELKKARDIAFDMQRIQTAMSNPTPENQALVNEILSDPSRRKAIQKALNISFFGGEDKRKPYEKQAIDIWGKMNQQGQQGQAQGQAQQQPQQQGPNYFQQLQRMMPSAPQLSTEMMLQAEMVKMGLAPTSNEQLKAITSFLNNETKYNETVAKLQTAIDLGNQKAATEQNKIDAANARKTLDSLTKLKEASIKANAQVAAASVRANAENNRTQVMQQATNQLRVIQSTKDQIDATTKTIKALQDNVANKIGDVKTETNLIKQLTETNQKLADSLKSISGVSTDGSNGNNSSTNIKSSGESDYQQSIHDLIFGGESSSDEDKDEEP